MQYCENDFDKLSRQVSESNRSKGFIGATDEISNALRLALVMTEASEAIEALRSQDRKIPKYYEYNRGMLPFEEAIKDTVEDELADIIIRCLDFAGVNEIPITFHIIEKLKYNATRKKMHGKLF